MDPEKRDCMWGGGDYSFEQLALRLLHASCQSDILSNHIKGNNKQKTNKPINQGNDKTTLLRFKVTLK